MDSEESIIKLAKLGNEQAFRVIVETYQSFVYAICFNVLKDKHEAENAAQETFLQVYKALPQYDFRGFKTWLGRIALNKGIDCRRKTNSLRNRETGLNDELEVKDYSDDSSIQEEFDRKEDRKRINEICGQLPEIYRKIIHMFYIQEKAYSEIAAEIGVSIKTVESRLYRARKLLKEKWKEEA